ncbi:MAG TPA: DsbA family protein [Nitrospiraceae bacterium]|nr:DsbA family protein [Nitrospiraceae bacterium]
MAIHGRYPQKILSPPVHERDHILGPSDAEATLVEYGDFECPYAREGTRTARRLQASSNGRLRFVFRHFPLTDKHPHAQLAAEAAEAAAAQGKFWEMADLLFRYQDDLTDQDLIRYADTLSLDVGRFIRDLQGGAHAERVEVDVESGAASGVTGTPTFFINNRRYDGADDPDTLRRVLEQEMNAGSQA